MAGYLFQPERALYRLATSPKGSLVGIETLDDVAVIRPDGTTIREQDKHTVGDRVSVTENGIAFWKTLNIWLSAVTLEELDLEKTEFHLVTNKIIASGLLNELKTKDREPKTVRLFVKSLKAVAKNLPQSVRVFSEPVVAASEDLLGRLLSRLQIIDGEKGSSGQKLKDELCQKLVLPKGKETEVLQSLLGWVHDTAIELIRNQQQAWLSREAFEQRYLILVTAFQDGRFLNETAEALIPVSEEDRNALRGGLFVKQLLWLGLPEEDEQLVDAIDDLFRSKTERIRLAQVGSAAVADFKNFEDRLISRWKNIFRRHGKSDEESEAQAKGIATLSETLDHREPLASFETLEYYLTRGSYHLLADGPPLEPKIGWHPYFKNKCSETETATA